MGGGGGADFESPTFQFSTCFFSRTALGEHNIERLS